MKIGGLAHADVKYPLYDQLDISIERSIESTVPSPFIYSKETTPISEGCSCLVVSDIIYYLLPEMTGARPSVTLSAPDAASDVCKSPLLPVATLKNLEPWSTKRLPP